MTSHECMLSCFSRVQLFATSWTVAFQAPLSMGFSRQEYWSGLPYPPPSDLPDPGIDPGPLTSTCIGRHRIRILYYWHHLGSPHDSLFKAGGNLTLIAYRIFTHLFFPWVPVSLKRFGKLSAMISLNKLSTPFPICLFLWGLP